MATLLPLEKRKGSNEKLAIVLPLLPTPAFSGREERDQTNNWRQPGPYGKKGNGPNETVAIVLPFIGNEAERTKRILGDSPVLLLKEIETGPNEKLVHALPLSGKRGNEPNENWR